MRTATYAGIGISILTLVLQLQTWTAVRAEPPSPVRVRLVHEMQDGQSEGGGGSGESESADTPPPAEVTEPAPPQPADGGRRPRTSPDATAPRQRPTTPPPLTFGLAANRFPTSRLDPTPNMYGHFYLGGPTIAGGGMAAGWGWVCIS